MEDGNSVSGRVPRFVDCELKDDLVGTLISGDNVIISGILKTENAEATKGVQGGAGAFKAANKT